MKSREFQERFIQLICELLDEVKKNEKLVPLARIALAKGSIFQKGFDHQIIQTLIDIQTLLYSDPYTVMSYLGNYNLYVGQIKNYQKCYVKLLADEKRSEEIIDIKYHDKASLKDQLTWNIKEVLRENSTAIQFHTNNYDQLKIKELGDYKEGCQFILKDRFKDNVTGIDYIVALTSLVDIGGLKHPIDKYLNKKNLNIPSIIKERLNSKYKDLEKSVFDGMDKLKTECHKLFDDLKLGSENFDKIVNLLDDQDFDQLFIEAVLEKSEEKFPAKDVFDELIPEMLKENKRNARIIFPVHISVNWLLVEIRINKTERKYYTNIYAYAHYPYAQMLGDKNNNNIRRIIQKRVKGEDKNAKVVINTVKSLYANRLRLYSEFSPENRLMMDDIVDIAHGEYVNFQHQENLISQLVSGLYLKPDDLKMALQQAYDALNKDKEPEKEYALFDKLADQYLAKGEIRDYPKVVAIYQYMMKLQPDKKDDLERKVASVEEEFIKKANGPGHSGLEKVTEYKKRLEEFRGIENSEQYGESVRARLKGIEGLGIKEGQEKLDKDGLIKRAEEVEKIYMSIREFFIGEGGLIKDLISDCIKDLGGLPKIKKGTAEKREVEYAIFGMGSMALGTMTPWSDMEFGILIEDGLGDEVEEVKDYFRNLTNLLHIRVINFGETPLRMMGIEELNNFKSGKPEDDWFYDELIKPGFSFDGPHAHACKTPLGRQGYKGHPDFELIRTADQFMNFYRESKWSKDDPQLLQTLMHYIHISGSPGLMTEYSNNIGKCADPAKNHYNGERAIKIFREDLDKYSVVLEFKFEKERMPIDVKKSLYRLSDRIIVDISFGLILTRNCPSTWKIIDLLHSNNFLSKEGSKNLKNALSIAVEFRLRNYSHSGFCEDNLSISTYEGIFSNWDELVVEFYKIVIELQRIFRRGSNAPFSVLRESDLICDRPIPIAVVYARLNKYIKAEKVVSRATGEQRSAPENLEQVARVYENAGISYFMKDEAEAKNLLEKAFKYYKLDFENLPPEYLNEKKDELNFDALKKENDISILIGAIDRYDNLACVESRLKNKQAIEKFEKILKYRQYIVDHTLANEKNYLDLIKSYYNLGGSHFDLEGDIYNSLKFYNEALKIIEKGNSDSKEIRRNKAIILTDKGKMLCFKGDTSQGLAFLNYARNVMLGLCGRNNNDRSLKALDILIANIIGINLLNSDVISLNGIIEKYFNQEKYPLNQNFYSIFSQVSTLLGRFSTNSYVQLAMKASEQRDLKKLLLVLSVLSPKLFDNYYHELHACFVQIGNQIFGYASIYRNLNELSAAIGINEEFAKMTSFYFNPHNLACMYHVKAMEERGTEEKESTIAKARSTFESALKVVFEDKARSRLCSEYAQFLVMHHDKGNNDEYKKIVGLLEKAIEQGNDGSGLGYGKIERETVVAPLQEIIDEKYEVEVRSDSLARYLLTKIHLMYNQHQKAREALTGFSKIEDKTEICEKLYKSAQEEMSVAIKGMSWAEYIRYGQRVLINETGCELM